MGGASWRNPRIPFFLKKQNKVTEVGPFKIYLSICNSAGEGAARFKIINLTCIFESPEI